MDIKIDDLNPYIRIAMFDTLESYFHIERSIWDYELIFIEEGNLLFTINRHTYECTSGDILLIRPRKKHILTNVGEKVLQPHIHFDLIKDEYSEDIYVSFIHENKMSIEQKQWFRKDVLKSLNLDLPYVIRLPDIYEIKKLYTKLIEEHTFANPFHDTMKKSLLIQLLIEIKRGYDAAQHEITHRNALDVNKLTRFVYKNIDQDLSIDVLANSVNLSKWYFIKLFKETYNTTPKKYISTIKLKIAKELIQNTNKSINDIALSLGYNTPQAFTRWFKLEDGKNPSSYRVGR